MEIFKLSLKSIKNKPKVCLIPKEIITTKQAAINVIIAVLERKKFSDIILDVLMLVLYLQLSHLDLQDQYVILQDVHL